MPALLQKILLLVSLTLLLNACVGQKNYSEVKENSSSEPYINYLKIKKRVINRYSDQFNSYFSSIENPILFDSLYEFGRVFLNEIYEFGLLPPNYIHKGNTSILLIVENTEMPLEIDNLFRIENLFDRLSYKVIDLNYDLYLNQFNNLFFELWLYPFF